MPISSHGWRRKTGRLFVLVALTFAVAWYRSASVTDDLRYSHGDCATALISHGGKIVWIQGWLGVDSRYRKEFPLLWASVEENAFGSTVDDDRKTFFQRVGFDYDGAQNSLPPYYDSNVRALAIPYWFIILLITLFVAYLLLSKPQEAKPKL